MGNVSPSRALCKKSLVFTALFCAFLMAAMPAGFAVEGAASRLQTPNAKAQTVQALQAAAQNRWTLARQFTANAKDPLANKLYYWMMFQADKSGKNYTKLVQFIRHNPEWPGMSDLRLKAEKHMPTNLSAAEVVAWFDDYPPQTAKGLDRYLKALIASGQGAKAKSYLSEWWATTTLPREDQRMIYRKYAGYLDHEAHRRRFDMLLYARQYTNARAIAQVLKPGYVQLAEARIALAEKKPNVNVLISRVPAHLQNDPGLLYERLRWRRRENLDFRAMEILHNAPPVSQIQKPEIWWRERHILIRRLLEQKHHKSAYLLASKHFQKEGFSYAQAEWLSGWLALRFMKEPTKAYQHFEALYQHVKTPVSKARAAYWAGRAAHDFGQTELSRSWYEKAARYQTVFYGQMAGAELGLDNALPHASPPVLSAADTQTLNAREMVQAARLFHAAGLRRETSRFLQAFVAHEKSPKAYRFAAELGAEMNYYHDAVRISKEATKKGLFLTAQSYPVITSRLRNVPVEWALVHALIRQESVFDFKAQSPAGALGLMQLMPATAREVAGKLGVRHSTNMLVSNPDHNIRLGSKYLQDMLARFGGSYPLAIAAYNAGPGRVDRWLKTFGDPRNGQVDLIDWIELIPIYETRNYVQRVMEGTYVYRLRLNGVQKKPQSPLHIAMSYR